MSRLLRHNPFEDSRLSRLQTAINRAIRLHNWPPLAAPSPTGAGVASTCRAAWVAAILGRHLEQEESQYRHARTKLTKCSTFNGAMINSQTANG
jgi:hypothetical protein